MKKIILLSAVFFVFSMTVSAQTTVKGQISTNQELTKVTSIGQKLLEANNLPTKVTFIISPEEDVNAYANIDNEVHV